MIDFRSGRSFNLNNIFLHRDYRIGSTSEPEGSKQIKMHTKSSKKFERHLISPRYQQHPFSTEPM